MLGLLVVIWIFNSEQIMSFGSVYTMTMLKHMLVNFEFILHLMVECVVINSINSLEKKTLRMITTYLSKRSFLAK